jgi:hypothetical protein
MERNDLAFVVTNALGLRLKTGAWREARIRDLLHGARTIDAMGWPAGRWMRARVKALDWLAGGRV